MIIKPVMTGAGLRKKADTLLSLALAAGGMVGSHIWNKWTARRNEMEMDNIFGTGNPEIAFGSVNNTAIALKSAHIDGTVDGLFFSYVITQEYHNENDKALEIIYTFPTSHDTVLLGLRAKLGEKTLEGTVVENKEAEESYEKAIDEGNCAIMVQKSAKGIYTANLGNVKPGEKISVELRCARLLNFDQGRVRLCIPTVISERYGDQHDLLAPHESAHADPRAAYDFTLALRLRGEAAAGSVSCPTHPIVLDRGDQELEIRLERGAKLDRDFVLLMDGFSGASHAQYVPDKEQSILFASFCPGFEDQKPSPIALKILVDCSGSMHGERIAEARKGLKQVLAELDPADYVSYSRFGTGVRHMTNSLLPCNEASLLRLKKNIAATDADMGGTAMEAALDSLFREVAAPIGDELPAIVLLITDGDVWAVKEVIGAARRSGHRIFTVGVGSAPAESLLSDLAAQTGGACAFVTPGEDIAAAIVGIFKKMRGAIANGIKVDWHGQTTWQSAAPAFIYSGETVHCFAISGQEPAQTPELRWRVNGREYSRAASGWERCVDSDLARYAIARRVEESDSPELQRELALAYQIVTEQTSLILVDEREEKDKCQGLPQIQQTPQMAAHGHGSFGAMAFASVAPPVIGAARSFDMFGMGMASPFSFSPHKAFDLARQHEGSPIRIDISREGRLKQLENCLDIWRKDLYGEGAGKSLIQAFSREKALRPLVRFICETGNEHGIESDQAMACFVNWAFGICARERDKEKYSLSRHDRRALKQYQEGLSELQTNLLETAFADWLDNGLNNN